MKLRTLLPLFVVLAGCGAPKGPDTTTTPSGSPSTTAVGEKPGTTGSPTVETPPAPAPELPTELKNAAYDYYGLATTSSINLEIEIAGRPGLATGTQVTRFKEMKDGKAVYAVERTGDVAADLGAAEEVSLEKDGVYMLKSDVAKIGTHDLQLPADLAPGKTWSEHTEAEKDSQKLNLDNNLKVVGPQKVTTKLGDFDALLVTSSGKGTVGSQKVTINTKMWYAKGRGVVKMEMTTIVPGQKVNGKIVFQQVK